MPQDQNVTLSWAKPVTTGSKPSARSGHSLTIVGTNAFIFGGCDFAEPPGPTNTLYMLKMTSGDFSWVKIKQPGAKPIPRWGHSATQIDKTRILVFGGHHSITNRLNDVWILDTVTMTWECPFESFCEFTPRGDHKELPECLPNSPTPRGDHAAAFVPPILYIFGGYGGYGYSRRDMNDTYALNVSTMKYIKLQPKGKPPDPRSGHSMSVVQDSLYVFGGWNTLEQFSDIHVLDTLSMTWSSVELAHSIPRWSHAACSVEAIPHWKIFVFGGNTGELLEEKKVQGNFDSDVLIMDTGRGQWQSPAIEGELPPGRNNADIAYDAKNSRLLLFGGWANKWFDDLYTLDVGCVVGPPYAITDMEPKIGPITGGAKIIITGIDFVNSPPVMVRFSSKRGGVEDVEGKYLDKEHIECLAPNFEKWGAGEVQVRVSLRNDSFTTTFQPYSFFAVTCAAKSLAIGPGVLSGAIPGIPVEFLILVSRWGGRSDLALQARDAMGRARTNGGDQWEIEIKSHLDESLVKASVLDLENGQYHVRFTPPEEGDYSMRIFFKGTYGGAAGDINGSPFISTFVRGKNREMNLMTGPLVMKCLADDIETLKNYTTTTSMGLRKSIKDDNRDELLEVKRHLFGVNTRKEAIESQFAAVRATVEHLRDNDVGVEDMLLSLHRLDGIWEDILTQVPIVKTTIQPLVKMHATQFKAELAEYTTKVEGFLAEFKQLPFWFYASGVEPARKEIGKARTIHQERMVECKENTNIATMFECPEYMTKALELMDEMKDYLDYLDELWAVTEAWKSFILDTRDWLWLEVDADTLEENTKMLQKRVRKQHKSIRWSSAYKDLDLSVKNFLSACPLITSLHHPSMRPRHWEELKKRTKKEFELPHQNLELRLGGILDLELHKCQADVEEITDQAAKEQKIEDAVQRLGTVWKTIVWVKEPAGNTGVMLLKMAEEDFELLEADQLVVQSMMANRYVAAFEKEVSEWQLKLGNIADVVQLLGDIQHTWSYLEPLFIGSDEVKRELPEDAARFEKIDFDVKNLLEEGGHAGTVLEACNIARMVQRLEMVQEQLDLCKKSLADFLDGKRQQFPRFYFVSEADLLDILSNGANPSAIMQHISKVFLATRTFHLSSDDDEEEAKSGNRPDALEWESSVGVETVSFDPPVALSGKVEEYLQAALDSMMETLRQRLLDSIARYPKLPRAQWLLKKGKTGRSMDPAQIAVLTSGIEHVKEVESAFEKMRKRKSALEEYHKDQKRDLTELIKLTKTELSAEDRMRVMVQITMDAHARDIIDRLIRLRVSSKEHFQWQSQLKQRLDGCAIVEICDASFTYGCEYLGNGARLVITPLTDRIYVTATQALHLKMGCAPAGPAGTGKTESTKDLASALGNLCYVFNCSPEMDYKSLGNIFKGLAASGSWGCFDEFNRLVPEVLSVCSVQYKAVLDGIRANRSTVVVEGDEVRLNASCGVFITMNPGYLGRSELPQGLKALFRPMTVMVPDLVLICENMLMAEGFVNAQVLATKFYGLYSLLRDLLSKQMHYDWGLRAVKSVLVVAGKFKRAEPDLNEEEILCRALRDFNTPKIVKQDEVVFFGLLNDLFPGVNPPRAVDAKLEDVMKDSALERQLWPDPAFLLKVVQLEELLRIRHCVFVMGPAGCGKSETWKTLARANMKLGKKQIVKDLNPKAITPEELYGYVNMATRVWRDGLLSNVMRSLGRIPDTQPKWIVLDGDLDANWIESMNSVMDDNRMLTLASNERIPLKEHMRMLFEIRDLRFATPATVSRAGILYISTDEGSQWKNLIASWIQPYKAHDAFKFALKTLFDKYVEPILDFLKKQVNPLVPTEDVAMVQTLLQNLEVLLPSSEIPVELRNEWVWSVMQRLDSLPEGEEGKVSNEELRNIEQLFVFAAVWAFGSALSLKDGVDYREKFSEWFKAELKGAKFPARDSVFDVYLEPQSNKFESWKSSEYFRSIEFDSREMDMAMVTVPTPETCSVMFWMNEMVRRSHPVMLVGYAGVGKTQLVQGLLNDLDASETLSTTINFNFYTNSHALQTTLEQPLEKKAGANYGPPGKADMIFFVDDLNLPEVDLYGTQTAIALLRQYMDYQHWYDRAKLSAKNVQNCQFVACMNPAAGSFQINPRLQRHFVSFAIGFPGPTSLLTIYQTFLDGHVKHFSKEIQALSSSLINGALALHQDVVNAFKKTAKNFHYEFNIRHLSNVFQGLLVAQPDEFSSAEKFVQLWLHESERTYGDRLVSADDLLKFKSLALQQAKKRFSQFNMARFYAQEKADPLLFCHFADAEGDGVYDQVINMELLNKVMIASLDDYNEFHARMDLVLFEDAMKHVCRVGRIIKNPGGHALLVGVGGSGKQSLSRLAAHMCQFDHVHQIVLHGAYGVMDFKEDIKAMYQRAGIKDESVMFLFTDSQIQDERFLVYVNDMLSSGNIPDLYSTEERDSILQTMGQKARAALGREAASSKEAIWEFFLSKVRSNLHMVLCFSPIGVDFRNRALRFPAIVSCTVIDWFQPWPVEALHSVGEKFLSLIDLGAPAIQNGIRNFMPFCFDTVNTMAARFFQAEQRHVHTTPKTFLECLKQFKELLASHRHKTESDLGRLRSGIQKLEQTAKDVDRIREQLEVLLVSAEEKKSVSTKIAAEVAREKGAVERESELANDEADKCAKIQADVTRKQKDTETDLAKAEPMVEAAMAALDTLNKKDLGECKTMAKPPSGVDDVFNAVMVLFAGINPSIVVTKSGRVKDRGWDSAKRSLLSNVGQFLDELKGYKELVDANGVPEMNWKEIRQYLELEHFDSDVIATKNKAAAGICAWVVNIVKYYDVLVTVEPKRQALREANAQLDAANEKLKQVQDRVAKLQAKLDTLEVELEQANKAKQEAIDQVEMGQRKLNLSERLTKALGDENDRWAVNVDVLEAKEKVLVGDCLLASAFISYVGPFTKVFRQELIQKHWKPFLERAADGDRIPMSEVPDPLEILTTEAQIAEWNSQGLPADPVSSQNGAIVCNSARWPLLIDPQLQGLQWIRTKEGTNLQIVRLGQDGIIKKISHAIEHGESIFIENLGERIDAVLIPLISRSVLKRGRKVFVKLGDEELELHSDFKLFLHTKLSNPHYPPEIQAETTLVNFTVTEQGLEDQLLSLVVRKEYPVLAEKRERLLRQQNMFKVKTRQLEDHILQKLADAEGDVTEDVELIETLEGLKHTANEIAEKMKICTETSARIQETSEKYRPVASRGSLMFFLINSLCKVHSYYMFSLNAFVVMFLRGLSLAGGAVAMRRAASLRGASLMNRFKEEGKMEVENARFDWNDPLIGDGAEEKFGEEVGGGWSGVAHAFQGEEEEEELDIPPAPSDEEAAARNSSLIRFVQETVFNYVRRGLFEKDKLMLATQLAFRISLADGVLPESGINFLIYGEGLSEPGDMGPLCDWLPEPLWGKIKAVELMARDMPAFEELGEEMQTFCDEWLAWFDLETPEKHPCPGRFKDLTNFERLMILRCLRPDRLPSALEEWVASSIGHVYVTQPPFDMEATYKESSPSTPVFFVLFPGVDPTTEVEKLGKELGISSDNRRFLNISLGQGQEKPALDALQRFSKEGGWLMLQNVHLMPRWLPKLERAMELCSANAHPEFRCFISAEPPPLPHMKNIPESLLQSCIKVANEAPADLKSNLRNAWVNFDQSRMDECSKPEVLKASLFTLCFFHALVLGRRRFGQLGWSRPYSFNTGDLNICANVIESYLNNTPAKVVPWEDLRYIIGEIMYGGHITDPWDRRTNSTYLEVLFRSEMLKGGELAPGLPSPPPENFSYAGYARFIEDSLPGESPVLFGLHPNSEIGYLQTFAGRIFSTILVLEGGGAGIVSSGKGSVVREKLTDLLADLPEEFSFLEIQEGVLPELESDEAPYLTVMLQEVVRMNSLLLEMRRSLLELEGGLSGKLNISDAMQDLATALSLNQVPGRDPMHKCSWERLAWPSKKSLGGWFKELVARVKQLRQWTEDLVRPKSMWLPGLFNPTAYLTAVMQVTSRQHSFPLDSMTIETHVTTMQSPDDVTDFPKDGAFVHGLLMEGARWQLFEGEHDTLADPFQVDGVNCAGYLAEAKLKELLPIVPVMYMKAVKVDPSWIPSSVGYLRQDPNVYECPIHMTTFRGPTYVCLATLRTKLPVSKWVLGGVALIMQEDD